MLDSYSEQHHVCRPLEVPRTVASLRLWSGLLSLWLGPPRWHNAVGLIAEALRLVLGFPDHKLSEIYSFIPLSLPKCRHGAWCLSACGTGRFPGDHEASAKPIAITRSIAQLSKSCRTLTSTTSEFFLEASSLHVSHRFSPILSHP